MDEGMAAATAAASGIGNTYVYYRTVKPLKTLLTEINNPNITFPYTLQLTSDVSNHIELDENHLFAAIEINKDTIIRTDVYDIENFKKVYALHTLNPRSNVSAEPVSAAHASAEASTDSAMVTLGNPAASIGPVASAATDAIGAAAIAAPAADEDLAAAEEKSVEASATAYSNEELRRIADGYTNYEFGIGKYNNEYDDGWRQATATEWMTLQFRAALILAHQKGGGWPLLEDSLVCNNSLYVHEGEVKINGEYVVEDGFNILSPQKLHNVYPAMNLGTHVSSTAGSILVHDTWSVDANDTITDNPPCLFVKEPIQNNPLEEEQSLEVDEQSLAAAAASEILNKIPDEINFAVGYHSRTYEGWVAMTGDVLKKYKIDISRDYIRNDGLLFLNKQFNNNSRMLSVYDGIICIDQPRKYIIFVKDTNTNLYKLSDINNLNKQWIAIKRSPNTIKGSPCLFMRIPKK